MSNSADKGSTAYKNKTEFKKSIECIYLDLVMVFTTYIRLAVEYAAPVWHTGLTKGHHWEGPEKSSTDHHGQTTPPTPIHAPIWTYHHSTHARSLKILRNPPYALNDHLLVYTWPTPQLNWSTAGLSVSVAAPSQPLFACLTVDGEHYLYIFHWLHLFFIGF